MSDIKIRKLNNSDFWTVLQILRKGGKAAFTKMKEADATDDNTARGMIILDVGMEYAEKELTSLFAALADMTEEEYKSAPFDTTLSIVEQLTEQEDLANFFQRVAALARKFSPQAKATKQAAETAGRSAQA